MIKGGQTHVSENDNTAFEEMESSNEESLYIDQQIVFGKMQLTMTRMYKDTAVPIEDRQLVHDIQQILCRLVSKAAYLIGKYTIFSTENIHLSICSNALT